LEIISIVQMIFTPLIMVVVESRVACPFVKKFYCA